MLVILLALFMIYRWWRGEQDLKNMTWKINPNELNYNTKKRTHSSAQLSAKLSSNGSIGSSTIGTIRSGAMSAQSATRGQIFTTVAEYKGQIVAVKKSNKRKIGIDRKFMLHMKNLSSLKHTNLTAFVGVSTVPEKLCGVWEYCNKGSIQDVIENDDIRLDTMFKLSIAIDICQGLEYIHKSPIKHHGNMKSSNCVIDSRWVCKLTDFGIQKLKPSHDMSEDTLGPHAYYAQLFWTAPELLRVLLKKEVVQFTTHGDIYALGIIIKELLCRNEPYCMESNLSPKEIITNVAYPKDVYNSFRPDITDTELDSEYRRTNLEALIQRCWTENPEERPAMKTVLRTLNKINPYKKSTVVDNMVLMMEKYTNNLEDIVAERTEQLEEEKRKTDALLYRMLPRKVADDLKCGRPVQAEAFDSVTIYFSDIVQFTNLATESTPYQIVDLLNSLYTLFDDIISHYDVYKVETIGDAYMIVSGLPERNGNLHVKEMAWVALNILRSVLHFRIPHKPDKELQIRIGLHTGSVVAGVVGLTMPRYCLFGDTVNTASRMESNGQPQKIHMSPQTKTALEDFDNFIVEPREEMFIKGKGMMQTHWLTGVYHSEDNLCREPDNIDNVSNPDDFDYDKDDYTDENLELEHDNAADTFEGKISIADSGIGMDKGLDERFGHVYLGIGIDSTGSSDETEFIGEDMTRDTDKGSNGNVQQYNTTITEAKYQRAPHTQTRTHGIPESECELDFSDPTRHSDINRTAKHTHFDTNNATLNSVRQLQVLTNSGDTCQNAKYPDSEEMCSPNRISDTIVSRRQVLKQNLVHEYTDNVPRGPSVVGSDCESDCTSKNLNSSTAFQPPVRLFATNFNNVQTRWQDGDTG